MTFLKRIGLSLCLLLAFLPSAVFGDEQTFELRQNLEMLEAELLNSKDLLTKQRNTLANLNSDLRISEKTIKNLRTSIANLEKHISGLEITIANLKRELANSREASTEALNSLDEASRSLRRQTGALIGVSVVATIFLGTTIYLAVK